MNNIPKFRAWLPDCKEMHEVIAIAFFASSITIPRPKEGRAYDVLDPDDCEFILMQSTGLKDKNGFEIFEGDILNKKSYRGNNLIVEFGDSNINMEEYSCNILGFYLTDGILTEEFASSNNYEIIGNIHQNPELLEIN